MYLYMYFVREMIFKIKEDIPLEAYFIHFNGLTA